MKKTIPILALCVALTACTRTASLMPDNSIAAKTGAVTAVFKAYGMGNGEVSMTMADGEELAGRYQLDRQQNIYTANTNLLVAVFGKGAVQDNARETVNGIPLWSPGAVDASSSSGKTVHCQLMNNNNTGHGRGACKLSMGAIYRLQY